MYINYFCAISPVGLITPDFDFSTVEKLPQDSEQKFCREPDYTNWIKPIHLRRMSKPVRMSVTAAKICLDNTLPDAINVGTAYGILYDTEIFLKSVITQNEQMIAPTSFIQSTHNTVAGAIALALQSNVHNMTFVHKAHSFENALLDGHLLLGEQPQSTILVGAVEELTKINYDILKIFDIYKDKIGGGEGASFFKIKGLQDDNSIVRIKSFYMFKAGTEDEVSHSVRQFIKHYSLDVDKSDLLLTGSVNDNNSKNIYHQLRKQLFPQNEIHSFKQFCGEYPTASSFGLIYASLLLKNNPQSRCWMINNFRDYWSIWFLEGKSVFEGCSH